MGAVFDMRELSVRVLNHCKRVLYHVLQVMDVYIAPPQYYTVLSGLAKKRRYCESHYII